MADITLINLNMLFIRYGEEAEREFHVPLGPLYLTTAIENAGFEVDFRDYQLCEESDLFDLQLSGAYDNYLWDLYYQNYIGIYVTDQDNIAEANLPRVNSFSYGLGFKYFFSDNYSRG